jgi:hypothetical protein
MKDFFGIPPEGGRVMGRNFNHGGHGGSGIDIHIYFVYTQIRMSFILKINERGV